MAKNFKKMFAVIMALAMAMILGVGAYAIDLTGEADNGGENWTWSGADKELTLNGDVDEGFTLVTGSNVYVVGDSTINGGDGNALTCEGLLNISGSNKLTLTGSNGIEAGSVVIEGTDVDIDAASNGIKAESVTITDGTVDIEAGSMGIRAFNDTGDAEVILDNVDGSITGGFAGIFVQGECADTEASVVINESDLEVTSEATSWHKRALKAGIAVYTSLAENVNGSITINDSNVVATGYDAGLSINNYVGDADATNAACSTITINNSTVVAEGTSGVWAGIFASVLGQHEDADATINVTDSSVYAVSPNTGILTSSQYGESKIVLDNSILGADGKTALSMIEETSQKQVAELKNGSTYVQMTPDAVMKGEIANFDGKTIIATAGEGITYDKESNYFVIPQGSAVIENFTDGTSKEYKFERQAGGVGGFDYAKEEVWGFDKWATGDIIIYTPEELIEFAGYTQDGTLGNCEGRVVKLGNDIDMTGYDWYYRNAEGTIVTDHRIPDFVGTFDGQGYAIKNMNYRDEYAEATEMANLAFIVKGRSFLKDLTIDTITVDTVAPAYFAGLVKDYAGSGSSESTVDNCNVKNVTVNSSADLTFGGMFYRLVGGKSISDSHVENITINANGAIVGDNNGRNGGFVATGGEPMTFTDCSVKDFEVNAGSTGKIIGGFIGGASMSGAYYNCNVDGFELNASDKVSVVGGFAGYTAGSAWGSGLTMDNCHVTGLDVNSTARISVAGGFIGYTYGQGKSLTDGAHNFNNCSAKGSITAGADSKVGGFIGWLYGREKGCAVNFVDCYAAVNVYSDGFGGAFAGYYVPYGSNIIKTSYDNCTASGDVFATEPVGSFIDADDTNVDGIIGGTYNYDPENVDSETGETNNVARGYRALDNGDGTWTVFPDNGKEVVKIAFHRWNDETDAYENWRTVEVFKDASFLSDEHNNELNYSHPIYRFKNGDADGIADGLAELNKDAGSVERIFTFWTDVADGLGDEVLTNETVINGDMNVYVAIKAEEEEEDDNQSIFDIIEDLLDNPQRPQDPVEIETPEVPAIINDEDVPLADTPNPPAEQYDVPSDTETIIDENVPLADVPGLGDETAIWMLAVAFAIFGLVVINLPKRKREDD